MVESKGYDHFLKLTELTFNQSAEDIETIDFDDMLFFPHHYDLQPEKVEFVLCDEIQDFNKAQIELILKTIGGRSVGVGDRNQSCYVFRGAMLDAMDKYAEALDCEQLPLSISFRVPKVGEKFVNENFPHIQFSVPEWAREGRITESTVDQLVNDVTDGDMVVCRTNAPLVAPVFECLRNGKKAFIVGGDIGKGLKKLIEDNRNGNLENTLRQVRDIITARIADLERKKKELSAATWQDRLDTIVFLAQGCETVNSMLDRIDLIFTDELQGIAFSSIHRAKGLEAKNVFLLDPSLIPHPKAESATDKRQEKNIHYVGVTRFKDTLTFVN
jgi:superfamily I DNA/RNA helicase